MGSERLGRDLEKSLDAVLGYLNLSSGVPDPGFLASLNNIYEKIPSSGGGTALATARVEGSLHPQEEGVHQGEEAGSRGGEPKWRLLATMLGRRLKRVERSSKAFQSVEQAEAVLELVFEKLLPAYRHHHRDLLLHQTDGLLFGPFFVGRACEAILAQGGPWSDSGRIVQQALAQMNDFLGYRPVAVLETGQQLQPYDHEAVRPIPLYVAGVGVAVGPYHDLIERTLRLFESTDRDLLDQAWFDPALLDELALDPRAFDFDHPVNRRPNHHFGGWDPRLIDGRGRYRRFVLQQVTLDALIGRADTPSTGNVSPKEVPRDELLFEAAAVLAGTMLMGSGITGSGPDTHDSSTTLASLLPIIAGYRDEFYARLLEQVSGAHARRLQGEATTLRQPFGGARQHLNQLLALRRAEQLQHVHLALLYARMGYTAAALRQAHIVPVASARMRCEMDCRITRAHFEIDLGQLEAAASLLPEVDDLLHRAIECGAMVDPWNMLGFGGQFNLFPAVENSVHDHRIDDLIDLMNDILGLYSRLEKEAAAVGADELKARLSDDLAALVEWWDRFASTEVGEIEGVSGQEAWESTEQVASAISAWTKAGTAGGDIAFWRKHVERFRSPKAFALLAETLLDRGDLVASMALLMLWLSRAEHVSLGEGDYSFHHLAVRWLDQLWAAGESPEVMESSGLREPAGKDRAAPEARWPLAQKFFDYLEANADEYWEVPRLELTSGRGETEVIDAEPGEEEDDENPYRAAYENVVYSDTTDDGFDADMLEGGSLSTDFELAAEAERIVARLAFLSTVARLWRRAALASVAAPSSADDRNDVLDGWLARASENRKRLLELLNAVQRYPLPRPASSLETMIEYDRRRGIQEALLERIANAYVETADAGRCILVATRREHVTVDLEEWEIRARPVLRAIFHADGEVAREAWPALAEALEETPLLYIPTSRGGKPSRVVASRSVQRLLRQVLRCLPRMGLLTETYELIETIQRMERNFPAGPGALTEFDRHFQAGWEGIVECLVASSEQWSGPKPNPTRDSSPADSALIDAIEHATERVLQPWLEHSRGIRISVLESIGVERAWKPLKKFIRRYGHDLFTQRFMNFGILRAILHEGVGAYLDSLEEESDQPVRLLNELGSKISREKAIQWLEITIEAVVENYSEYIDYNSTTTQSDRGDMLHTLLDFLRLRASYDRIAWNLKPVITAHQVMVRMGRNDAAAIWESAVAHRSASMADEHLERFEQLSRKYGMRLPSIADRLGERFVRPLEIGRLCSLVRPAVEELRSDRPKRAFDQLEQEVARFTEEPSGVGFELPGWLESLEEEAAQVRAGSWDDEPFDPSRHVPQVRLSQEEATRQIESFDR